MGFAVTNFVIAVTLYRCVYDAPFFGAKMAALVTGESYQWHTQQNIIAAAFDAPWRLLVGVLCLGLASIATGACGACAYVYLLRMLARKHSPELAKRKRWPGLKSFDAALDWCGATNLAMVRGASYWLVTEQAAKLRSGESQVYADVMQGDRWKLYTGKVIQVIGSRAGETISVLLEGARRYHFVKEIKEEIDPETGKPRVIPEGWTKISDSEAFYMRGEEIHNISYRIYGDLARGGYTREPLGNQNWFIPPSMLEDLRAELEASLLRVEPETPPIQAESPAPATQPPE